MTGWLYLDFFFWQEVAKKFAIPGLGYPIPFNMRTSHKPFVLISEKFQDEPYRFRYAVVCAATNRSANIMAYTVAMVVPVSSNVVSEEESFIRVSVRLLSIHTQLLIYTLKHYYVFACLAGTRQCIVDKARRNWCPFCRLQKCLRVNMNVTGKPYF